MSQRRCKQQYVDLDGMSRVCGRSVPAYYRFCDECRRKRIADRTREKNRLARKRPMNVYSSNGVPSANTKSADYSDSFQSGKSDCISPDDEAERWTHEAQE